MTWMQRAIADADRTQESATAVRLKSEAAKYAGAMCRP
jgi:hypothetical protein